MVIMIKLSRILCLLAIGLSAIATAAPSLKLKGSSTANLGNHPAWEQREVQFILRNNGNEVMKILKIRKTCGCSEVSADPMEVPPGKTSTIKVVMLPNALKGPYSKNIFVQTSDPEASSLRLTVTGTAEPLYDIRPKAKLHAGQLPINKPWQQTFVIRQLKESARLGSPQANDAADIQVELLPPNEKHPNDFTLSLTFTPLEAGPFRHEISIPVLEPKNHPPLTILIYGKAR